jgi:capsular polysaccharide biosynthesis protein
VFVAAVPFRFEGFHKVVLKSCRKVDLDAVPLERRIGRQDKSAEFFAAPKQFANALVAFVIGGAPVARIAVADKALRERLSRLADVEDFVAAAK